MRIVHVSSEFAPLVKSGGLGDAVGGLTKQLALLGEDVHILIPKYNFLKTNGLPKNLHLIDMGPFNASALYGFPDDVPRFLHFCKASKEYLEQHFPSIDVLHLHDWHAAPLASLCRHAKKTVLSIHNLEYQGKCGIQDLQAVGIKEVELFQGTDPRYPESYNCLKGGIESADEVIAVSPTYAKEIITPEFGFGLDQVLLKKKPIGIVNGIDREIWAPTTYKSTDSPEKIIAGKQKIKDLLGKKGVPWIGSITRLVPQKGPELILAGLEHTVKKGGVFALLGSAPDEMRGPYEKLKQKYAGHPQVLFEIFFNDELAHQLYAALDFLIVPSHFEPCGLTQLIAMAFGTIPIVRATGGLKDTVNTQNGFTFNDYTPTALCHAIDEAMSLSKSAYHTMIKTGIESDLSWKKPALEYLKVYASARRLAKK